MSEGCIHRGEISHRSHQNFVRTEGDHRGGRSALERDDRDHLIAILSKQVHDAQGCLSITAAGFEEEIDLFLMTDLFQQFEQCQYIVVTDTATGLLK